MIRRLIALAIICLITPTVVQARPVSYTGGWTFIETSNRLSTAGLLHYTINPKVSLGLRHERMRDADTDMTMAQGTWLVKRWFGKDYQANVYTMAGVGTISDNSGELNPRDRQFYWRDGRLGDTLEVCQLRIPLSRQRCAG